MKIKGITLHAGRVTRNNNLYLEEELKKLDGVKVPLTLNFEEFETWPLGSPTGRIIETSPRGLATMHWNEKTKTLDYRATVNDTELAWELRHKRMKAQIASEPGSIDVFHGHHIPKDLKLLSLSITQAWKAGDPDSTLEIE